MHSEAAEKTRYAAQMMAATAVLASTAPDDFRRRCIGRISFIYCHEFVRYARQTKNEIRRLGKAQRDRVQRLEPALERLAKHDFGPYEVIRHRIAAHRQPFDADTIAAIQPGNDAWHDISDASLRILAEDARAIWNEIDAVFSMAPLNSFPPVAPELDTALKTSGYEPAEGGVAVGVGSFDATRDDAILAIRGGDGAGIARELVDAIRNVQLLSQIWQAVNGHEPFQYLVLAAVHVEACTLHDLTFGQPASTAAQHKRISLLEHLTANDPNSPALPRLQAAKAALPSNAEAAARNIRNRIGAHIDDRVPLTQSLDLLRQFDPALLNNLLDHLFAALDAAGHDDIRLVEIKMGDAVMTGFSPVFAPDDVKAYT